MSKQRAWSMVCIALIATSFLPAAASGQDAAAPSPPMLEALLARADAASRVANACVREDRPADACAACDPARER